MKQSLPSQLSFLFQIVIILATSSLIAICPSLGQDVDDVQSCFECHAEEDLTGEINDEEVSMYIDPDAFAASMHGDFGCIGCHSDIEELPHDFELEPVDCSTCHSVQEELTESVHEMENGPSCKTCHGDPHMILPADNADSPVNKFNVQDTCGKCHSDESIMDSYKIKPPQVEALYEEGVHAKELLRGNEEAPSCADCHGYHSVLPLRNIQSKTNFFNVAETCGQCHTTEKEQFLESEHGVSVESGHKDAPVCTDCHGEHSIYRVTDERSPVSFFNLSDNTCGRCHASIVINEKYKIASGKVENFFDSYHGLALQRGSKKVANCGSCHGNHLILPPEDPRSTVSQERLVETCGTCHPGISENVLAAPIHSEVTLRSDYIAAWVPRIYIPLIIIIIGAMLVHNGVILWALLKEKFKHEKKKPSYTRFTTFEIICHIFLTISFIVLVITGFALVNPRSWWVTLLSYMQMTEDIRQLLHRIAGVILIATSLVYAAYMLVTKRGRQEFIAFLPYPSDVVHVWQHISYHLGKRKEPPQFGRYDYTEKMEFWALIWGVVIMAVTGLILWFPIMAFANLPKWAIDIAELIHYYEAVLATLAIVIWHFFFVIFHPEEYPMSTTWLTGKMSVDHLKHRHPMEYEQLKEQGLLDEEDTKPQQ